MSLKVNKSFTSLEGCCFGLVFKYFPLYYEILVFWFILCETLPAYLIRVSGLAHPDIVAASQFRSTSYTAGLLFLSGEMTQFSCSSYWLRIYCLSSVIPGFYLIIVMEEKRKRDRYRETMLSITEGIFNPCLPNGMKSQSTVPASLPSTQENSTTKTVLFIWNLG